MTLKMGTWLNKFFSVVQYVPLVFMVLWTLSACTAPSIYGRAKIYPVPSTVNVVFEWHKEVRAYTVVACVGTYLVLFFYFYKELHPILRVICSMLIPWFGTFFYEAAWTNVGWVVFSPGVSLFNMVMPTALGAGVYLLHIQHNILDFSRKNISLLFVFMLVYILSWVVLYMAGWNILIYQYEVLHIGPDPCGFVSMVGKVLGISMWLCIARVGKKGGDKNDIN